MGRKANPVVIGAFVLSAIALAVVGLLVFGSGQLFRHMTQFVCFFPGTVDGLNVGAPVRFKGVEVGSVKDIRLRLSSEPGAVTSARVSQGLRIPVTIEIDNDRLADQGAARVDDRAIQRLVELGLRAQLAAQSLVTGLLFVQLDFRPDIPAEFVLPRDSAIGEIPTIPTTLEQVQSAAAQVIDKLEEIHFDQLINSAIATINGIHELVDRPEIKATIDQLPATMAKVDDAIASVRELVDSINREKTPLMDSLRATSANADQALIQARSTLQSVQVFVDPNSPLASQLTASLGEISSAARAVRLLADYLERNPAALLRGKDVNQK